MASFTVSYDLQTPGKDYSAVINEMRRLNGVKVLLSVWYLPNVNSTAKELRDHLTKFVDKNDRIFVADTSTWAGWQLIEAPK